MEQAKLIFIAAVAPPIGVFGAVFMWWLLMVELIAPFAAYLNSL